MQVLEYLDEAGRRPFANWFDRLDPQAATKVTVALTRIGLGNLSNAKSIDGALFEYRIASGPGYRIYFGRDGDQIVILLGGGTKRRQQQDIKVAQVRWADYKRRMQERH
jgi:putative addiction module killer protein